MDLSSTFKTEVYRPVVTILIPGGFALLPFEFIAMHHFPVLGELVVKHAAISSILAILAAIAIGFLLENFGALIESKIWDRLQKNPEEFEREWYNYWRLAFRVEPLGHRYLRTVTLRLKFELSFSLSIILFIFGVWWLNSLKALVANSTMSWITLAFFLLFLYLLWESYQSSKVLRKVRHELLQGVIEQPPKCSPTASNKAVERTQ